MIGRSSNQKGWGTRGSQERQKWKGKRRKCRGKWLDKFLLWGGAGVAFFIVSAWFHLNLVLCRADAGGSVRYADPGTGIQQIIDEASSGDTVLVRKGCYREGTISLKEGISLAGMAEDVGEVVISGDPTGPVIEAASHTTIENLVIRDGEVGICGNRSCPATDITIEHNLIIKNRFGMLFVKADRISLTNTTIAHNVEAGVLVVLDPNGPVFHAEGNIIAFNKGPYGSISFIQRDDAADAELTSLLDPAAICLRHNNIYDSLYHLWFHTDNSEEKIPLLSPEIFGPGNFAADPCFADPNSENYRLLSSSPCIDRGDPRSDYSYEPQPNGRRVNLGFYGNTLLAAPSLDSDDDGLYDYQEGNGDLDGDSLPDWQDADTAAIPLPFRPDKLFLHLQDMSHDLDQDMHCKDIQFKDVQAVCPSDLIIDPPVGILPFDLIQWKASNLEEGAVILVKVRFPQDFHALGISRYLASSPKDSSWQSLPIEIDQNETAVTYAIEDGCPGDRDGTRNGVIEHLGGLTIPESITWKNPESCFIALVNPSFSNQAGSISYDDISCNGFSCSGFSCLFSLIFLITGCFLCCSVREGVLKKHCLPAFFIFIAALLSPSPGWAQVKEDIEITSSAHPVGSGARALGMAGAFIGIADDATAASWNPAGLKHLGRPEISWVKAYSSRKERYEFEESPEASGSYWLSGWNTNYLSLSCQRWFWRLRRNLAFSMSYQHLYDFSKKLSAYHWRSIADSESPSQDDSESSSQDDSRSPSQDDTKSPYHDMEYQASYEQSGGLRALCLASSVDVIPSRLTFGLTVNIWSDKLFPNEWIEKYHKDGQGILGEDRQPVQTHTDVLEKYTFCGLNFNLGLLWDIGETLTLGAVYKTPFTADLEHTTIYYRKVEYSHQETLPSQYNYSIRPDHERLSMPRSYGIGLACQPVDQLVVDIDIYRTEWGEYELLKADGSRINPVTGQSGVKVKPTHQIRFGGEYVWATSKALLPAVRAGVFYDPAPAPNQPDDFYGFSLGFGLTIRDTKKSALRRKRQKEKRDMISIDAAYQYRWGKSVEGETIRGEHSAAGIDHHLVYLSAIYYF
ncbi:MAG: outer membrane protein transport protein [bacterium]